MTEPASPRTRHVAIWLQHFYDVARTALRLLPYARKYSLFSAWPRGARGGGSYEVVMLVFSNLRVDPRVKNGAQALARAGFSVSVLCPDAYDPRLSSEPIDWGPGIVVKPLGPDAGQYVFDFPWFFGDEMHRAAQREKPLAYHCHDLTTAMIGLSAAISNNAYLVCDFHEWWSENVSWDYERACWGPHPPEKRAASRLAERLVMRRADAVITVCDSIARDLEAEFPRDKEPVQVIRNIPPLDQSPTRSYRPLREELGLSAEQFIVLWQGGTGPSRLLEPVIESLRYAPDVVLVIRGPSLETFGDGYRKLAAEFRVEDRLFLLSPVPSSDVVSAAASADAGIWTLPNISKNFYYALPNKIFEYLAAGVPALVADFPEARKLVVENGVGLSFDPYDARSIASATNRLAHDRALTHRMKAAIPQLMERIDAKREWDKLAELYSRLAGCEGESWCRRSANPAERPSSS